MEQAGWAEVARQLGAAVPRPDARSLAARRAAAFGPAMEALFYDVPVEVARAEGVWITDTAGRRYLDVYNNVPCVGHGHPRVTAAISRQGRRINTHMRYLHPAAIELAERLVALCPPELDTVLLVNSGSEANDLAWRMATAVTGRRGGLCTAYAYHGITEATAALSPESWFDSPRRRRTSSGGSRPTPTAASTSTARGSRRRCSGCGRGRWRRPRRSSTAWS